MKFYLVVYNVLSALGWSYVLVGTVVHLLDLDWQNAPPTVLGSLASKFASILPYSSITSFAGSRQWDQYHLPAPLVSVLKQATTLYPRIGIQTAVIQSFAALEIFHALFGWVGSSPITTGVQVWTRLEAVWGIAYLFPQVRNILPCAESLTLMSIGRIRHKPIRYMPRCYFPGLSPKSSAIRSML